MTILKKLEKYYNIFFFTFLLLISTSCDNRTRIESNASEEQVIDIKKGERFYINLPEDHSTGYLWFLNSEFNKVGNIDYINSVYHSTGKGNIEYSFETKNEAYAELNFFLVMYRDTMQHKKFIVKVH